MKQTVGSVLVGIVALIVMFLVIIQYQRPRAISPLDLLDLKRTNEFSRIEFSGQRRNVLVTNGAILRSIGEAFRQPQDRGSHGGITYDCLLTLKDGSSARI